MMSAKSSGGASAGIVVRPKLVKIGDKEPARLAAILVNGLVAVTPELAHRVILECGYERQRGVRPLHVSALATQMRRKEWTGGTQIHFARMADGWLRLLDGQHRLHAVVEANTTVEFQVLVSDCNSEADVQKLYRRHDRLAVRRTTADILKAEGLPAAHGVSGEVAGGAFKASLIIGAHFSFNRRYAKADPYLARSDEARLRLLEPIWPAIEQFADAMQKAEQKIKKALTGGGPMAVAIVTLRDQEAKADAFWRGLANNDGLSRNDPRAAYRRYMNIGGGGRPNTFQAAKAASLAWNAFFDGRELEYVRVTDAAIRISGCNIER